MNTLGTPPPPPGLPPSVGRGTTSPIILLMALVGLGAILCLTALVAWAIYKGFDGGRAAAARAETPAAPAPGVRLPAAERDVPHHDVSLLHGCEASDVRAVATGIGDAIEVGAPLYNAGNFAGCYHMYEGAAADVERKLGASCAGPRRALEAGRTRAASLANPSAQAWAMRDAFDGLLDVIERSERGK